MDVIDTRFQVGQRLHHPVFGDGLVVEVHTDRGREVLEVVFDGQLRRLSAQREWEIVDGELPAPVPTADGEPAATVTTSTRVWHPHSDALLRLWGDGHADESSRFDLRGDAEHWAGWAGTDHLISLDSLRGVERFPHQIKACLKVMRDLNGRGILADEVGLGK